MNQIQAFVQGLPRIPLSRIKDPSVALRSSYASVGLDELGDSMVGDKLIYPVILEPIGDDFEVIIGSRRVKAARRKKVADIPALILEPQSRLDKLLMALSENIHRADLDPFEEGGGYLMLVREYDMEVGAIALRLHKSKDHVKERIQLLSLPEEVQDLIADGMLAVSVATVLARVPSGEAQIRLARQAAEHKLTNSQLRRLVDKEVGRARRGPDRVIPYQLTAQKFTATLDGYSGWFKRAGPRLKLRELNLNERSSMTSALDKLEQEIRLFKMLIAPGRTGVPSAGPTHHGNLGAADEAMNHGAEWTTGDIKRIMSDIRPSDEVLAQELGRTTGAIKSMRAQMRKKRTRKH